MPYSNDKIAALLGSRICHDLIGPVGAVGNGLELLALSGLPRTPELALVAESAAHAAARIRLFRLAFGAAGTGQHIGADELSDILGAVFNAGRLDVSWQAPGPHPRAEVRAVLLALLCAEAALGASGKLTVLREGGRWCVRGNSDRINAMPALWAILTGAAPPDTVAPAAVQFLLLPPACAEARMNCDVERSETAVTIRL